MKGIKFIHENCDSTLAKNKTLPNNAYLVTYKVNDKLKYDIVQCSKVVDIFDEYYDKYKKDLIFIKQTEGTANPKLWNGKTDPDPVKKK